MRSVDALRSPGETRWYVVARYLAVAVAAAEALFYARVLGAESYGYFALVVQTASLMLLVGTGSASGYHQSYFTHPGDHEPGEGSLDHDFVAGSLVHFLVGGLVATALLAVVRPYLAVAGLLFLICVPYHVTEPMLRVRRSFVLPSVGRAFGPLSSLLGGVVVYALSHPRAIDLGTAVKVMLLGNAIGFGAYYALLWRTSGLKLRPSVALGASFRRRAFRRYVTRIVLPVLPYVASAAMFTVFSYVDRFFIEKRFQSGVALSVYSLALQLCQGSLLVLTTMNTIASVRIGERFLGRGDALRALLRRETVVAALAGAGVVALQLAASALLFATVYADYRDLVPITMLVGAGYVVYNVAGSVTPLLVLERRFGHLVAANAVVLAVSLAGNACVLRFGLWYGVAIATSSTALAAGYVWLAVVAHRCARRAPAVANPAPIVDSSTRLT